MVKWDFVCRPKSKGGLGVKNLKLFNISLLWKWWWKLEAENGPWQDLAKAKYQIKRGVRLIKHKLNDSAM